MKTAVLLRHLIADVYSNRLHIFNSPVSFTEYSSIIKHINHFNSNSSFEFILSKYIVYFKNFKTIVNNKKGHLHLTNDLGIFSRNQFSINYYLDRGWSPEESSKLLSNRQNTLSIESISNRHSISLDEAKAFQKSITDKQNTSRDSNQLFKENRKNGNNLRYQSYLNKLNPETGCIYKIDEAKKIVSELQKSRSIKTNESKKLRNSYNSIRTYSYYIKKGFTPSEAAKRLSDVQGTNTLSYYISKYGEIEGPLKFKARQDARLSKINSKSIHEILEIRKKQCSGLKFYSNASFKIFNNLIDIFEYNNIGGLTYMYGKNEFCIKDDTGLYYYDFYIKELNFVIEFNGIAYHPYKDKLSESEWSKWTHPYTKESADLVYARDNNKLSKLSNNNIDYFIIWENDNMDEISESILSILKTKIKKQKA